MAGSGVRLFVSGEVAYAADINSFLMDQVISRFANSAARDAAFGDGLPASQGGSGKPSLSEGRFCYLDDINEVQYYNGSTWQSASQFTIDDESITNVKISPAAAIALSKLASGTSAQVIVANSSGVPTYRSISGDISISNTGVATIAANSVALGTDTTGNYMSGVTGGTGITVTHTPGEGSSATVAVTSNTYQPIDSELTAIAGLVSAADTVPYFTGSGTASTTSLTSTARSLLDDSSTTAMRTTLGVGTTDSPSFAGLTADNIQVGITAAGEIDTSSGNLTIDSAGGTVTIDDNLIISGDLTVNGTTTTVTGVTADGPVFTVGGDTPPTSDDNKDRGIQFRWHTGALAKLGFFGYDDSTGKLTFIPDATNSGDVFSGTLGTIDVGAVHISGSQISASNLSNGVTGSGSIALSASPTLTGTPTLPSGTIATTQTAGNSTTALATTAFVTTADNLKANLASPTFTGTVGIPMPIFGYSTTATAAGTTTLVNTSNYRQVFTGTTTQTIVLPVASTMVVGQGFIIVNNSTGSLTLNSSGGNFVLTVIAGLNVFVKCILASGTTAASWDVDYSGFSTVTGSGENVLATSPTLTTPSIGVATGTSFNSITGLSSTTPVANGTAAVGTGTTTARADHVHPTTGLGLTSGTLGQFAATTSSQLAGVISDETGSGALVFGTSPAITTSLTTGSTSFDLVNTTATTLNFAGAATALTVGATTGTTTVRNVLRVSNRTSIDEVVETVIINGTALTGTVQIDANSGGVHYFTANASADWVWNIRGDSSTTLDSIMSTGQSMTFTLLATNGATLPAKKVTSLTVDTTATVNMKWFGANSYPSGNASSIDAYTFTVIKTGTNAFTVLGSQSKFA